MKNVCENENFHVRFFLYFLLLFEKARENAVWNNENFILISTNFQVTISVVIISMT